MAVALSTLDAGSFFTTGTEVPTQKYLLSKATGTAAGKLVAYNLTKSVLVEFADDVMVTEIALTVGTAPVFTL